MEDAAARPILVVYEPSAFGDAAAAEASLLARAWRVPLLVLVVIPVERRSQCWSSVSDARWNRLMREPAISDLGRARQVVAEGTAVGLVLAAGSSVSAVAAGTAASSECSLVVLARRRLRRRSRLQRTLSRRLDIPVASPPLFIPDEPGLPASAAAARR